MTSSKPPHLPRPSAGVPSAYEASTQPQRSQPPTQKELAGRRILLCVTGSVAAYKAAVLLRLLQAQGAIVDVILTRSAERFVTRHTFSALTGRPVYTEMFDEEGGERHVALAAAADLIVIAPATADVLARLAHGRASELVTATALSAACPILVAPAMHPRMWSNPSTQQNLVTLRQHPQLTVAEPAFGSVASGDIGTGRMREPEEIARDVIRFLSGGPLRGQHIVVTAGPTVEAVDPVRHLTNRSSGKMGFAIAARAALRGAKVTLIAGPCELPTPPGVMRENVRSALDMQRAIYDAAGETLTNMDALIMAAAVADYRFAHPSEDKMKRGEGPLTLELIPNPDILGEIGAARTSELPVLIGFALETAGGTELIGAARRKLANKKVDLIVANQASDALEKDDNRALLVGVQDCRDPGPMSKLALADEILDWLAQRVVQLDNKEATG